MASTIQIRVDDELKTRSDELFKNLGMQDGKPGGYSSHTF